MIPWSRSYEEYQRLPIIRLSDLVRRRGALFAQAVSHDNDSWLIEHTLPGGVHQREITSACRLITRETN